ncbi:DsbA family protein [Limnohabitans sp.]|uniref:DsbA family oxidoreductase n=1 Tax=Limnohabitans sp. TaxID=1907725 RepID=UPI0038B9395F
MKIDFVSDVSCPWCAIGLKALETALERVGDAVQVRFHLQPFELNPQMPPGGQDITEHLTQKYGSTPAQAEAARENIRQRGEAVGFQFRMDKRSRIYNTFDAHRLLHWAQEQGQQVALKHALFEAYFGRGENPGDRQVLLNAAGQAGLDVQLAAEVIDSGRYAEEVREREQFYQSHGIHAVPAVIINDRHLIQGGQPVEVFEQALRQLADAV